MVITDVIMNGLNGIQLAARLAETLTTCRILLISGNANTSALLADWSADEFAFPILAKPVHPQKILEFVSRI